MITITVYDADDISSTGLTEELFSYESDVVPHLGEELGVVTPPVRLGWLNPRNPYAPQHKVIRVRHGIAYDAGRFVHTTAEVWIASAQ